MNREYMVVSFGTSKKNGKDYSRALRVKGDKNQTWAMLDEKDVYYAQSKRPLGDIINVSVEEAE